MNQNNYDGGGATYSRPDTGAHESKCQKNRPDSGATPAGFAALPVPVSGAGYSFFKQSYHASGGTWNKICRSRLSIPSYPYLPM